MVWLIEPRPLRSRAPRLAENDRGRERRRASSSGEGFVRGSKRLQGFPFCRVMYIGINTGIDIDIDIYIQKYTCVDIYIYIYIYV